MTVGFAIALVVGILAFISLLVLVIVLFRHAKLLARSVSEFRAAVQPMVEDIQREGAQAADHAARLSGGVPGERPGARIRR
jgi:uncharacterized membrane protein